MPFEILSLASYERCLKKLGSREQAVAELVVRALRTYFKKMLSPTGAPFLFEFEGHSHKLVFKKLQGPTWEAYIEGRLRILTRL